MGEARLYLTLVKLSPDELNKRAKIDPCSWLVLRDVAPMVDEERSACIANLRWHAREWAEVGTALPDVQCNDWRFAVRSQWLVRDV